MLFSPETHPWPPGQLSVEVGHELHSLQEQLAGHYALISQRLDALVVRCGGAWDQTDSPGKSKKSAVPKLVAQTGMEVEHVNTLNCSQAEQTEEELLVGMGIPCSIRSGSKRSTRSSGREEFALGKPGTSGSTRNRSRVPSKTSFGIQRPSDIRAAEQQERQQRREEQEANVNTVSGDGILRMRTSISSVDSQNPRLLRTMFAHPELMEEKLLPALLKQEYRVEDKYRTEGYCQQVARSQVFEIITLAVIFLNVLWIGYDVEKNPTNILPDSPALFQLVENLFCFFFFFELLLRFLAFKKKQDSVRDPAFLFDAFLLSVMIAETWFVYIFTTFGRFVLKGPMVSLLRMLRLSRMARLVRLLRAMPELMVLIRGLKAAFAPVAWTLGFLLIIIYVFSVAFNIMCKETDLGDKYFNSVLNGMRFFLLPGLLPEHNEIINEFGKEHILYAFLFLCFVVVGTIMVMNMLIGVLVEVVSVVAAAEKEELDVCFVKDKLQNLLAKLDKDKNCKLSKDEVESLVLLPGASKVMSDVGVDVVAFCEIAEFYLFERAEEISFEDFISLVFKLRGSNNACVRDMVFLRQFIAEEINSFENRLMEIGLGCAPPAQVESQEPVVSIPAGATADEV